MSDPDSVSESHIGMFHSIGVPTEKNLLTLQPANVQRWTLENLFGGLSPACDFVDLVQNGFHTRPVAHQGHDLALARPPLQGSFERRSCTSTTVSRHRIHPPNRFWKVPGESIS